MLAMRTLVQRTGADRNGIVFAELAKQTLNGDKIVRSDVHAVTIVPGKDVETKLAEENAALLSWGEAAIEDAEWDRVRDQVALSQTPDVVVAFQVVQQAAEEEREAQEAAVRAQEKAAS